MDCMMNSKHMLKKPINPQNYKMKKTLISTLFFLILSCQTQKFNKENDIIYNLLIDKIYPNSSDSYYKKIIIGEYTKAGEEIHQEINIEKLQDKFPSIQSETYLNFIEVTENTKRLTLSLNREYQIISQREESIIFYKPENWNEFYIKYPQTNGLMKLSAVGFNKNITQALVYCENIANGWDGFASIFFFDRKNGNWTLIGIYKLWVS